jgi:DNA-directed RNA polymerase specialized sigma24 family protein
VTAGVGGQVSDAELAARFRRDPELFTAVYDRYFRAIYLYVAGRLGVHTAEDIAAETFLVAFGQRDRFDPEPEFWVFPSAASATITAGWTNQLPK